MRSTPLSFLVWALIFGSLLPLTAQAALYAPGETLDPACAPTDVNCGVTSQVGSGIVGQVPYYAANGSVLTATSSITVLSSGRVGIGTTTPGSLLTIASSAASGTTGLFSVGTTSTSIFTILANGRIGIGTTTPLAALSVTGGTPTQVTTRLSKLPGTLSSLDITADDNAGFLTRWIPAFTSCATTGQSALYINDGGGFYSCAWMVLSGHRTGDTINPASSEPSMSSMWSDVNGPTLELRVNVGSSLERNLTARDVNGNAVFNIGPVGDLSWAATGAASTSAYYSRDVSLSRLAAGTLALGNGTAGIFNGKLILGQMGIGTTTLGSLLTIASSTASGTTGLFGVGTSSSSIFTVLANGNVGVGTTTPFRNLSVVGTSYFSGLLTAPIQDSGGQMYNVQAYGILPDGVEHTAALTSLLSTATAGSTIYFPCGTYLLNHFTIPSSVQFVGASQACVILQQNDASQTNFITESASNVSLQDMTIVATNTTTNGISYGSGLTNLRLARITQSGALTNGVIMTSASQVHVESSTFSGNGHDQFIYNLAAGTTASGIYINDSTFDATGVSAPFTSLYIGTNAGSSGSLQDIFITNNRIIYLNKGSSETDGLVLANGLSNAESMSRVSITGNVISADTALSTTGHGVEIASVTNVTLSGNTLYNSQAAILLETAAGGSLVPNGTVSGNTIYPNGSASAGGSGIDIVNGTWTVSGNSIVSPGYPSGYGISINDRFATVIGNNIYTQTGLGIQIAADDAIVNDNNVFGTSAAGQQGIVFAGTTRTNVMVRNNHLSLMSYGIYALATNYTKAIVSGNTFTTVSNPYFGNTTTAGLFITDDSTGNKFGIGTTSPFGMLSLNPSGITGPVFVIGSSTKTLFSISTAGDVTVNGSSGSTCTIGNGTGGTSCTSDERLKTDIALIVDPLKNIEQLRGVTFKWSDQSKDQSQFIGVIAQDVQKVFPQAVSMTSEGYLSVDYGSLIAPLIEAVKEIASVSGEFKSNLIAWLGSSTNGISNLHANSVDTGNLCVKKSDGSSVCITGDELDTLLKNNGQQVNSTGTPDASPIIITDVPAPDTHAATSTPDTPIESPPAPASDASSTDPVASDVAS